MSKLRINPDMVIFNSKHKMILDLFKKHEQLAISPRYLSVLNGFSTPVDSNEVSNDPHLLSWFSREEIQLIIGEFQKKDVLLTQDKSDDSRFGFSTLNQAVRYFYYSGLTFAGDQYIGISTEAKRLQKVTDEEPQIYKEYNGKQTDDVSLPNPSEKLEMNVYDMFLNRQTIRFCNKGIKIGLQRIADLFYYSLGETAVVTSNIGTALYKPTATPGARAATECYFISLDDSIPKGIYHYSVKKHLLECLNTGDFRNKAKEISGGQMQLDTTSGLIILTERMDRLVWKYPNAGAYKSALIETGMVSQNMALIGTFLNLGVGFIEAFNDQKAIDLLKLNPNQEFVGGIITVGDSTGLNRFDRPGIFDYINYEKEQKNEQQD
ncbi:hypothetical protein DA798_07705 [Lactobacillus sp. PFC-70]|nr:hypothetical protein DA798_07705 [Lactobacillus sp. PFC-70]